MLHAPNRSFVLRLTASMCAQPSPHQRLASPHQAPGSTRGPVSPAASAGAHPAAALAQQQAALRHQQAQQVHAVFMIGDLIKNIAHELNAHAVEPLE